LPETGRIYEFHGAAQETTLETSLVAGPVPFFTCARPGRSKGREGTVSDSVVDLWVRNLPGAETAIVSLLGVKPNGGGSELSFYSFYNRESFQQWLDRRHPERRIQVVEHPTTDFVKIPSGDLAVIAADIDRLLSAGRTVVLVDSGGETRTRQVARYMDFVEDTKAV
jgi:hypothetical protein